MDKEHRQFVSDILKDKRHSRVFAAKVRELDDLYCEDKQNISEVCTRKFDRLDVPEWYHNFIIDFFKKVAGETQKKLNKFRFYHSFCLGKVDDRNTLDIENAKSVPIGTLLGEPHGKTARRQFFLCPLHDESTASFCWYKKQNKWWCFGCGIGGDVIDLYQKLYDVEFKEAIKYLTT